MADRQYLYQLEKDFFERNSIQLLSSYPNGDAYIVFFIRLICNGIDTGIISSDIENLKTISNKDTEFINDAITKFLQLGIIEKQSDGSYYIEEAKTMAVSKVDSYEANKQRRYRERKKQSLQGKNEEVTKRYSKVTNRYQNETDCYQKATSCYEKATNRYLEVTNRYQNETSCYNGNEDIKEKYTKESNILVNNNQLKTTNNEIEKKEENIKEEKRQQTEVRHRFGEYNRVLLTDREYERLCADYTKEKADYIIKQLDEYVEQNNNKNKYTNFNLVIRKAIRENWFDRYKPEPKPTEGKSFDANEWLERKLQHNEDY